MFKFELGSLVKLGNYHGGVVVVARAEYVDQPNQYLCKYQDSNGIPVCIWYEEPDLS